MRAVFCTYTQVSQGILFVPVRVGSGLVFISQKVKLVANRAPSR